MKNLMTKFNLLMSCLLFSIMSTAQTMTKITPSPVSGAVCPNIGTFYQVSIPSGFENCTTITWSATNGTVTKDNSNQTKAYVVWNDAPGAKGKVTATFSGCGNSNDNKSASLEELILSVNNQPWGTYGNNVNVDYCTPTTINLAYRSM